MPTRTLRITADNPSAMTLEGTNTYLLTSADDASALLIDPGPELAEHRANILDAIAGRCLSAVVFTHRHADHTEMFHTVSEWAPDTACHAVLPEFCRGADPLIDGQQLSFGSDHADAVTILATPGHTSDSVSLLFGSSLFTGDTVLGEGTTMIAHPEGSLGDYMASLARLRGLVSDGVVDRIEPAHGPARTDAAAVLDYYISHRHERIEQVRGLLEDGHSSAEEICDVVYPQVPDSVRPAALQIVRAQLAYVDELGSVS
ncbi:MBL fold metallo-hydrolase [Brevibacterium luteolum]|uniref:MBL fold metallo-hydrolase n=1 Tax=Brevibacterium luteolum TaxID=199591 RepID=UPI00223BC8D2|nr:MBL fold metallo-hydrolase [Brevibacterium luteolum]MCT1657720.1 MBL fold metallo-hydrolase [Brevibacterium luteolum]